MADAPVSRLRGNVVEAGGDDRVGSYGVGARNVILMVGCRSWSVVGVRFLPLRTKLDIFVLSIKHFVNPIENRRFVFLGAVLYSRPE
jgi:hypothetical protein